MTGRDGGILLALLCIVTLGIVARLAIVARPLSWIPNELIP